MLSSLPLAFALGLDVFAIDQKIHWAGTATLGLAHVQGLLAAAQGAVIGNIPIQTDQPQQALYKTGYMPKRHPEPLLKSRTGMDRRIAETLLSPSLDAWLRPPSNSR